MGRHAVEAGRRGAPFAFLVRAEQHDPLATAKLEELLIQGGIEIHRTLEPFRADGEPYPAGTDIILLSQPYRAYVKTLLERQTYPVRRPAPGAPPDRPYDVAGWTLPEQMGVDVVTIERYFEPPPMSRLQTASVPAANVWGERRPDYYVIDATGNGGAIAINRLVAAGAAPSWIGSALVAGGFSYQPGSIVVPYVRGIEPVVAKIASELGLRADGVKGKPPGAAKPIGRARVALYKPWGDNIDEGWTRWLLERYEFTFSSIADADIRQGNLRARYDAIILPSAPAERLTAGLPADTVPPEYSGGLGAAGVEALKKFVQDGGTLICLDQSGGLALEAFNLPLRDAARDAGDKFFCPGSLLRLELDPSQPLAYGMQPRTAAFFAFSSAYEPTAAKPPPTNAGHAGDSPTDTIQTVARYATKDVLVSGWLEGEPVVAGRSAVVQAPVGAGRVMLLGFRVQHRGQSHATFRFLFNAILTSAARDPALK
jgi:hypothetical protein